MSNKSLSTAGTHVVSTPPVGTYRVNAQASSINFTVRHFFGLVSASGVFAVGSGELTVTDPLTASSVTVSAMTASFETKNPKRDAHVKTADFLDAETFPELSFRSTSVVTDGATWTVCGVLTAHGIATPLDLRVLEVESSAVGLSIRATGRVDRYAHDVIRMKGMVGRHVDIDVIVRAERI